MANSSSEHSYNQRQKNINRHLPFSEQKIPSSININGKMKEGQELLFASQACTFRRMKTG